MGRGPSRIGHNVVDQPAPVSGEAQGEEVRAQMDFPANRDLKYLLAQLHSGRNQAQKAKAMLSYLYGCGSMLHNPPMESLGSQTMKLSS